MPKNITIAKYDIDIESIQKKIQQIQNDLSGSETKSFIPKTLLKDMDDLQKKLEKFRKTSPVSTSTHKDIEKFLKEWERVSVELDDLDSKMSKISFSDTGIKENIKEVSELVNKYKEAVKARKEYAEKITSENGVKNVTGGIYRAKLETKRNKMAEAATKGSAGIEEIKATAQEGRIDLKDRLTWINQNRTNPEIIKKETKEVEEQLKLWNAIEQSALRYAENQQRNIDNENELNIELEKQVQFYKGDLITGLERQKNGVHSVKEEVENTTIALKQMSAETLKQEERQSNINTMTARIKDMFSAATAISTIRHIVRGAIQDFQELDKQFNEIAIVSDYTTKEMWQSFASVNKVAQEFGVETKNVLEVQNLYYHQGKDMAEVNKLTAQTLTLAKITGMDYERATSDLTAALNAYNIAAEDAVRVTDTIAAMDTNAAISSEELMTALTKTASIAANAGMSLESTEVFLTKMIETTREAPENLGTALKTIIARFGEVKQEIDGEEIELADINRVDTALKSIGISLLDTAGQIRDLDGVFMELSSKWDDLDRNTQRYIATIAAGSRQQSRFIAMMEDYDRTLELTEIAQNSAGLGARQLAKSQESIETSVNRLKSTWQEFYSSLITSGMIKGVLELANSVLSLVNGLNDISPLLGTIVTALAIWGIKTQIADKLVLKLGQSLGQAAAQTGANTIATQSYLKNLTDAEIAISFLKEETEEHIKTLLAEEIQLRKTAAAQRDKNAAQRESPLDEITDDMLDQSKVKDSSNYKNWETVKQTWQDAWDSSKKDSLGGDKWKEIFKESWSKKGIQNSWKNIKGGFTGIKNTLMSKLTSVFSKIGPIVTKIVTVLPKIITFITELINPITVLIAVLGAGFAIYRKYTKLSLDDAKKVEKLQKSQEEYNKTLKEYNDLKEKAKIIEKYSDRKNLSTEQLQEQQEAAKALVNEYPELLNYIDEEGNYYLKDAEAIQAVIDKKQELLDQEATNYTELRLKYAQEGIYADETTPAGKTMKNIQSYAASLDEDQLKEAAKKIDAAWEGIQFNSANYKKMMKAFGEGKKFSFDEKDMSSLFEGDISEDNWNEFLEAVKENPVVLENESEMAKALYETGAYTKSNAEQVAEAFMKMNEENGKLFSQLIQGAAEEYSQIEISYAKIQIEKGDFAEDLSSEVKEGLSEIALQQAIEDAGGEEKWKDLDDEKKTDYIESATEALVDSFEDLSKQDIQGINAAITSANVGGLKFNQATGIDFKVDTVEEQKKALEAFWGQLPKEIQRQLPLETIQNGSDDVIKTLFEVVSNALEGKDPKELWKGIYDDFLTSADMYGKKQSALNLTTAFSGEISNLSLDQMQALANATGKMSIEQIYPYLQNVLGAYAGEYSKNGSEKASELFNILTKTDFSSVSGIAKATGELKKFGWTAEQVAQFGINTMNGIDNITLDNFDTTINDAKSELEGLMSGLEGVTALIEGSASIEQLGSYMNTMMSVWTEAYGAEKAGEMMADLSDDIVATGDGFKIGASAGMDYAESLTNITKEAIITKIALLELKIAEEDLSEEEIANAKATIAYLKQYYSYVDAQQKKTIQDGLIKDLEKAKEKADELLESMKAFVDWLREFDKYQNIDEIIKTLEQDFEDIEFEMSFSTNTDVIEKDIEDTITNINTRMAATQGKLQAAQSNMQMQRDVIEKRNSQYVSFDADGNAIVNAQELQKLQEQIKNADEEHKPVLQAKYDEIIANVEAYKKEKDIVNESTKDLQELAKAMEDFLKAQYDAIMKVENKLIDARMAAEDKELDAVKEKYDAIKEENDKYLESVQDMIDEERRIRDRADKEQNVKDKEKKLAMMKMDTSGIYASDIRALEKEIEGDYRDLEDDAIDKAIDELGKSFDAQAEALDKEVKYLENALEYKREKMVEYNEWAQELMMQGSDAVIDYLKANDEEYYTGTAAAQANWELEWENAVTQGIAANNQMKDSLDPVFNSIMACKNNADGFKGAIEEYGQTALATNGEIEGSVNTLTSYYASLVSGVSGLDKALENLEDAYDKAADAAWRLKDVQDTVIYGDSVDPNKIKDKEDEIQSDNMPSMRSGTKKDPNNYTTDFQWFVEEEVITVNNVKYQKVINGWGDEAYVLKSKLKTNADGSMTAFGANLALYYPKYAKGGYVDYTGPAWVDGTKSHPEYMLNATQTQQFETLVAALSAMFSHGATPVSHSSQKTGDAIYNFHINVDQMASDYDVDQLISRIEEKMVKASQYRNVTLVKKQK